MQLPDVAFRGCCPVACRPSTRVTELTRPMPDQTQRNAELISDACGLCPGVARPSRARTREKPSGSARRCTTWARISRHRVISSQVKLRMVTNCFMVLGPQRLAALGCYTRTLVGKHWFNSRVLSRCKTGTLTSFPPCD